LLELYVAQTCNLTLLGKFVLGESSVPMSALLPKADINYIESKSPLLAKSGHESSSGSNFHT